MSESGQSGVSKLNVTQFTKTLLGLEEDESVFKFLDFKRNM